MKVAIVGGGISGLSTYLSLRKQLDKDPTLKDAFEITIYEPHDLPQLGSKRADDIPSSGGGYGLAANGFVSIYTVLLRCSIKCNSTSSLWMNTNEKIEWQALDAWIRRCTKQFMRMAFQLRRL
jgi:glycine/D-amino acid oxidase-like deaminating enzyme